MRWLGKGRLRFLRGQRGFTLVEVLAAAAILAAIGVGLLNALDTNAKATRTLDEKVVATNLATAYLEAIKALPYAETYPSPEDLITIPSQYDVDIRTNFSTDGGVTWGEYADDALQKITISISREGVGRSVFSMCTFRADL
ncbi:prepilin-type N-terminal cleavage/methylation domain-containing protein [Chloroflexota bacterium]